MSNWVPLHCHWESSYLDGILRYRDMDKIKKKGIETIAITDHGNLSGTYEFYKNAIKAGVKPIIGMEAYYALDRTAKGQDDLGNSRPNYHMILLAQNQKGYQNLVKLSSLAYIEGYYYSARIDDKLIGDHNEGIMATSACLGSRMSQLIMRGEKDRAMDLLCLHKELFKDRFFIELQCHYNDEQKMVNQVLLEFANKTGLPIIVTSDSHYMDCHDKELHDKFLAISTNSKLEDPKRFTFGELECHLPTMEEILAKCEEFGIPEEAITNTKYVSDMCTPDYFKGIINRYPTYKDLPGDLNADQFLEMLCKTKYLEKNNWAMPSQEIEERIDTELKAIKRMGFADYMLILWDIIENGARKNNIIVGPGRGSAAGSYVAYILGITQVDPLKHDLLFARFLNEGRAATPVIF